MRAKLLLVALGAALVLPSPGRAAKENVYAIVGARIVTVSGPAIENGTLVLRDGLIEAVGAGVPAPADARVIDGKGWTLTPGLIDGFGGVGLPAAPARAGGGGGGGGGAPAGAAAPTPTASPLAPQARALDRVRVADALRARDGGVTTALVISKDGVLPGESVLINLSGDKVEGMVLRQPAALHLHMTTLTRQYPGSLMGTQAYVRQALYDAIHYRDEWASYRHSAKGKKRPPYDSALETWQDVLARKLPLVVTASRENDIRRALALADEFQIQVMVAGAPQASRVAGLIMKRKLPLLVSVNFDPPRAAAFGFGGGGGGDDEQERKNIEEAERNPAELYKAGVPFALVSGHAPSFLAGVRKAIDRGLPREAALKAVTLAAADVLGISDRLGSLEPGKIANVVAWTGEPLAKDAKVKMVFVDGQVYEPEERPERPGAGDRPETPTPDEVNR
jgi:imidazolonepropionase-like amidohydrolase